MTDDPTPGPRGPFPLLPPVSRRGFLAAAAVGGATVAGLAFTGRPQAQPVDGSGTNTSSGSGGAATGPRIRRNIYALATTPDGQKTIESYRRGVAAMMARPYSDVTGWRFQAAIHRVRTDTQQDRDDFNALPPDLQLYLDPANMCQHGNFFFPAWHRIYLYYFERIVRKASGDPSFSLPYWNYSDSVAERKLPEAFRTPDTEAANPLFRALRATSVKSGNDLPSDVVATRDALDQTTAGPSSAGPGFYALMEDTPHGAVHVAVGGPGGLMSAFRTAALDPIFWLHHCNIDRLWASWIRAGHADPATEAFLNQSYRFWDEDGNPVSLTVREVLDSAATLDYRYDDAGPEAGIVLAGDTGLESGRVPTALAATSGAVTLGIAPVQVAADPLVEAGGTTLFLTDPFAPGQTRVFLVLEGIRFEDAPGLTFRIFLNHAADTPYDVSAPSYAGLLAPINPPGAGEVLTRRYDISRLLNRQIASGQFDGGSIRIEIVAANAADLPAGIEAGSLPPVTIDRIAIER